MQRHVHRADAQHGGIEIEAVEQALVEVLPQLVVLEQRGMMFAQIFAGGDQEAASADRRVADHVLGLGLHQLDHRRDDVARRAELAVLAGRGDLRQHVLVHVALGVAVAHVELVELLDDLIQERGPRDLKAGVAHMARIGRALAVERPDEREHMFVEDAEHLARLEMLEFRPAQVFVGFAAFVRVAGFRDPIVTFGKDAPLDRLPQSGGSALLQLLHLVEALDEDQVGDLLDHLQRVGEPARPEVVPDAIDLIA
jgi:hypothetical protein